MRALAWYVARMLLLTAAMHACGEAQSDAPAPSEPEVSTAAVPATESVMPRPGVAQASGGATPATGSASAADSGPASGSTSAADSGPANGSTSAADSGLASGTVSAADGGPKTDDGDADAGVTDEPASGTKIVAADLSATTKAWWAYERAPSYTVVTSPVKVPTRDGIELACTLSRPATNGSAAAGKFPGLVVEFTPYALQGDSYNTEAAFFTTRGYNALVCTVRGTGDSGGTWQHAFSRSDGRDAYDLVEWLATQPFSDGRIGQLGESYGGQTSYGAAVEQAPHLRAIAPMQPPADLYDNVIFPGGIEALPDGAINNWPPIAELLSLGRISARDEYASDRAHPTYDEYWQNRTLIGRHAAIQVPVLTIGGWQDSYFRSGTLMNIEGALDRTWAIYGPWVHMPPVDLGTCDVACVEDPLPSGVILAWMDHWVMELAGLPIPERPSFVSFENPKGSSRGFRELSAWVPQGAEPMVYELGSDGTLSEHAAATAVITLHQPTEPSAALSFTSAPLERDRVLLGHAALDLRAQLSAADAHFYVQLFDLDATGKETFVNDGFLKASHRASHTTPSPVPIGESVDYHVAIRPQHHRFLAGHRVLLRVWSGPRQDLAQPEPVDVTLETGASARLWLPGFAGQL